MSRNENRTGKTASLPETQAKADAPNERAGTNQTPAVKSVESTDLVLGLTPPRANEVLKSPITKIPEVGFTLAQLPSKKELAALEVPALLAKGGEALGCVRLLGRLTLEQVWIAGCYFWHAREKAKPQRTWTKDLDEAGYAEPTVRQAIHIYEDYPDFRAIRGLTITQAKERSGRVTPKGSKARQTQQGQRSKEAGMSQQGNSQHSGQGQVQMTQRAIDADDNTGTQTEPPPPPDWSRPVEDFTPPQPEIELPDPVATEVEWLRQAALYLAWLAVDMNPPPKYHDAHKTFLEVVQAWRNARLVPARSPRADARQAS